jgi:hypothetical protein
LDGLLSWASKPWKGLGSNHHSLQDGSALRLTTAKYYTPSHKVIHEHGITPDSIVSMSTDEEEALFAKRSSVAFDGMGEETPTRLEGSRDVQLERATDFLKGMLLYRRPRQRPAQDGGQQALSARLRDCPRLELTP